MSKEHRPKGLMPTIMEVTADNTRVTFISPLSSEKKAIKEARRIVKNQGASAVFVEETSGETPHLIWHANWTYDETTARPQVPDIVISEN